MSGYPAGGGGGAGAAGTGHHDAYDDGYGHQQPGNTDSYYDDHNGQYYDNGYDGHGQQGAGGHGAQEGYYDES